MADPSDLHVAAQHGQLSQAQALVAVKADVNAVALPPQVRPIHLAAQNGHNEIVTLLLDNGADLEAKTLDFGVTPLISAALSKQEETGLLLLSRRANPDVSRSDDKVSALLLAAHQNLTSLAAALVDAGADVNAGNVAGVTPLHACAEQGNLALAQRLIEHKANVTSLRHDNALSALHVCAIFNSADIASLILSQPGGKELLDGAASNGDTPLHFAIKNGSTNVLQVLVHAGADTSKERADGTSPYVYAAESAQEESALMLLRSGVTVSGGDAAVSCLFACQLGLNALLTLLKEEAGVDVGAAVHGSSGMSGLHLAAQNGHAATVQLLLNAQAEVNRRMNSSDTPLHVAARGGYADVVQVLLDGGADVNATRQQDGSAPATALDLAANDSVRGLLSSRGGLSASQL